MLRILMASQPARAGWLGGTAFSTVTHGALIALAVTSTGRAVSSVRESRAMMPERIAYVETMRQPAVSGSVKTMEAANESASPSRTEPAPIDFAAAAAAIDEALEIPELSTEPDLTAVTDAWLAREDALAAPAQSVVGLLLTKSAYTRPESGVYTSEMVERGVTPKRGNPTPRYPAMLAELNIEGDFQVTFVVDSTGVVRGDQIDFPSSMHRLFADAVRAALLKSRYMPAMFAGHVVPQQVVQRFTFRIGSRR